MKPRRQLPGQSKKRQAIMAGRRSFVRDFLAAHPRCQVRWDGGCTATAVHVHEPLLRSRGGSILDPLNAVATCWWCHAQLHAHPAEATTRGFMRSAHDPAPEAPADDPPHRLRAGEDTQAFITAQADRWLRPS